MDLQDGLPALQVRQLHGHPAVEPPGPQQRGVQGLGPVGGGQDDHALAALKAVHLRQELVQGLLPLVVAAHAGAAALFADGVDLVDEHDAGGLLIGLPEQVPDLVGSHAHEHLHELRAGDGEEGHFRLPGHGLGQQGLAGARRAHQQDALGHLRADLLVLPWVVEEVHHLHQVLLGLVLSGYVGEFDAGLAGDVDLGTALAELHGTAHGAAHPLHQRPAHELADADEDGNGQNKGQQKAEKGAHLPGLDLCEPAPALPEPVDQVRIVKGGCGIDAGGLGGVGEVNHILLHLGHSHLPVRQHGQEGAVVHLGDLLPHEPGEQERVEQNHHHQDDGVIKDQRFSGFLHFFHFRNSPPVFRSMTNHVLQEPAGKSRTIYEQSGKFLLRPHRTESGSFVRI